MNPHTKKALAELLHEMLGAPTREQAESACAAIKEKSKLFLQVIKETDGELTVVQQITHVNASIVKWREGKCPLSVDVVIEGLLVSLLWAAAFNKTLPEGLDAYCERLRAEAKKGEL